MTVLALALVACGRPELTEEEARTQLTRRLVQVSGGLHGDTVRVGAILHAGADVRHVMDSKDNEQIGVCNWVDERWICRLAPRVQNRVEDYYRMEALVDLASQRLQFVQRRLEVEEMRGSSMVAQRERDGFLRYLNEYVPWLKDLCARAEEHAFSPSTDLGERCGRTASDFEVLIADTEALNAEASGG
jgi:hypothetical protein